MKQLLQPYYHTSSAPPSEDTPLHVFLSTLLGPGEDAVSPVAEDTLRGVKVDAEKFLSDNNLLGTNLVVAITGRKQTLA